MSFVPRREKVRKGFTSPNGFAFLSKVVGSKDPAAGKGHVTTGDGRIGTRGTNEFSRPTELNKEKLAKRSEYYQDVHGFDPADDYKGKKKDK